MSAAGGKSITLLLADDNPLIRDYGVQGAGFGVRNCVGRRWR